MKHVFNVEPDVTIHVELRKNECEKQSGQRTGKTTFTEPILLREEKFTTRKHVSINEGQTH